MQLLRDNSIMKERPIPFSSPMVRAILAGTETQTRRVVKGWQLEWLEPPIAFTPEYVAHLDNDACPYGRAGDRLWVREAWRTVSEADKTPPRDMDAAYRLWFEADAPHQPGFGRYRPPMFMPRWASRITLELTGVRVERLNDISEADALAEGVTPKWEPGCSGRLMEALGGFSFRPAASAYADLWEQINGPGSWDANPWTWVVEFKQIAMSHG